MSSLLVFWVWLCAYLNCAGWVLSACHALNETGYAISLCFGLGLWWLLSKKNTGLIPVKVNWKRFRLRFHRGFPLAFLILAMLAFLGGVLYEPNNYDALAYRIPRIFHWLEAGHWLWIHTIFDRLNDRSCGIEWVSTPLLAFSHTTRLLFLINFISFLLLPGLVFSVFTRLGVRWRVAWYWMWLAPTGYCFLLQAGSIANDLFGALFVLAAIDFALRAQKSGSFISFASSLLAAMLMTSVKTNNLPLLLPWLLAIAPAIRTGWQRPMVTLLVCLMAIGASALPTIYFNLKFSGDWSGSHLGNANIEHAIEYRTGANIVGLIEQNIVPPVFPLADRGNQWVKSHESPALVNKLNALMEPPASTFPMSTMQTEDKAGLGFGLTVLLAISWLAGRSPRRHLFEPFHFSYPAMICWSSAFALFALLIVCNLAAIGRLSTAYYLLPSIIVLKGVRQEALVRQRWWRGLAWTVFIISAMLLIILPARPLFPRSLLAQKMASAISAHPAWARLNEAYCVFHDRSDDFAPVLADLPVNTQILGYFAYHKPEACLWKPFGSRRIIHVCPEDSTSMLKAEGIKYILISTAGQDTAWVQKLDAVVIKKYWLHLSASIPPERFILIELQ